MRERMGGLWRAGPCGDDPGRQVWTDFRGRGQDEGGGGRGSGGEEGGAHRVELVKLLIALECVDAPEEAGGRVEHHRVDLPLELSASGEEERRSLWDTPWGRRGPPSCG